MTIEPLPPNVIAQIKSSTIITSLNDVVCELLKNSLDAQSETLDISLDYSKGSCVVLDDGMGIPPSEFAENGGLGKSYHTSKLPANPSVHGGKGNFLASLSAMSLLVITSRHQKYHSHNSLCMHKSETISRQMPAPATHHLLDGGQGTRVTVRDLFGSMPVRVKQRAALSKTSHAWDREWEELRRNVTSLIVAWPFKVSMVLRDSAADRKFFFRKPPHSVMTGNLGLDFSWVGKVLSQASLISSQDWYSWVSVAASTSRLDIKGMISTVPSPRKDVQFLSLGIRPLSGSDGQTVLHHEINKLFADSTFGNKEKDGKWSPTRRPSKGHVHNLKDLRSTRKCIERWPMFYINIQQIDEDILQSEETFAEDRGLLRAIIELLRVLIDEFLIRNHFRTFSCRSSGKRAHIPKLDLGAFAPPLDDGVNQERPEYSNFGTSQSWENVSPNHSKDHAAPASKPACDVESSAITGLPDMVSGSKGLFSEWSIIKSGTVRRKAVPWAETTEAFRSQFLAPITQPRSSVTDKEHIRGPLLSTSGKVLRRPFEDMDRDLYEDPNIQARDRTTHALCTEKGKDERIFWVNPITKSHSAFNERTGHAVTAREETAPISQIRMKSTKRLTYRTKCKSDPANVDGECSSPWISKIIDSWENPVFHPSEPTIPQSGNVNLEGKLQYTLGGQNGSYSFSAADDAFSSYAIDMTGSISKESLCNAEIISQVDKKFILVSLRKPETGCKAHENNSGGLIIIDQHAADERIRIEQLISEFFTLPTPELSSKSGINTVALDVPIMFDLQATESALLKQHELYFAQWGILYNLIGLPQVARGRVQSAADSSHKISVLSLPPGILERCKLDPQLIINLLRSEVWRVHEKPLKRLSTAKTSDNDQQWTTRMQDCPKMILDMLNSRACRSAIMFNDELSRDQCEILVKRLSACVFPFQCAHGRPSLVPLIDLAKSSYSWQKAREKETNFAVSFKGWRNNCK